MCVVRRDPYKLPSPKPGAGGTCATHLIRNRDSCESLARRYHVTISELEKWNKGKTWAWTECRKMLLGYNMFVSDGSSALPPPQAGAACGPLVLVQHSPERGRSRLLTSIPACLRHAMVIGHSVAVPGTLRNSSAGGRRSGQQGKGSPCASNCGMDIKVNSGPPTTSRRIGYYESYNFKRSGLWLSDKRANTDGTYTHMHWSFAKINPSNWETVIRDPYKQWNNFKFLPNMKRIVALGGWAYSTEPATFNIILSAILAKKEEFAMNNAKAVKDQGLDGADIDWKYPGWAAPAVQGQVLEKSTVKHARDDPDKMAAGDKVFWIEAHGKGAIYIPSTRQNWAEPPAGKTKLQNLSDSRSAGRSLHMWYIRSYE